MIAPQMPEMVHLHVLIQMMVAADDSRVNSDIYMACLNVLNFLTIGLTYEKLNYCIIKTLNTTHGSK